MATTVLTPQIQFVTLAIGATAKQMGISATELYNSRTYALLDNPDSGLQLMSDSYILNDLLRELEA